MVVCSGSHNHWQSLKCRSVPSHQCSSDISDFHLVLTTLSDLPTPFSTLSWSSENNMNISAADIFTANITTCNISAANISNKPSMPLLNLFGYTAVDLDAMTLASFNQPIFRMDDSVGRSLPHGAIAADQLEVEYFIIPESSNCGKDKLAGNLGF